MAILLELDRLNDAIELQRLCFGDASAEAHKDAEQFRIDARPARPTGAAVATMTLYMRKCSSQGYRLEIWRLRDGVALVMMNEIRLFDLDLDFRTSLMESQVGRAVPSAPIVSWLTETAGRADIWCI